MRTLILAALLLTSCRDEEPCDADNVTGVYDVEFEAIDSTCPTMETARIVLSGDALCEPKSAGHSDDQCSIFNELRCWDDGVAATATEGTTFVFNGRQSYAGNLVQGQVIIWQTKNGVTCGGSYSFTAER